MKHYANNPLLTMDNIILTLDYIDVEKLDQLEIKFLSVLIDGSDMGRKVGTNADFISIMEKILL